MKKSLFLRIANTLCFIGMVAVNILANTLPIGDFNTGQISAMYPTLITPPGWTFTIWGLIYALLAVFTVRQLMQEEFSSKQDPGAYFLLSCLLNAAWILCWHYQSMLPAAIAILCLLAVLLRLYTLTRKSDLFTRSAFSIYYAWITAASLIMVFAFGKTLTGHAPITPIVPRGIDTAGSAEAGGISALTDRFTGIVLISGTPEIVSYVTVLEYAAAILSLILLTVIVWKHTRKYRDPVYLATILWALGGIMIRQATSITPPFLFLIVCAAAILTVVYLMVELYTNQKKGMEKNENQ